MAPSNIEIKQIILDKDGNIEKETLYNIDSLNQQIIAKSKLKNVRSTIKEAERIYKNKELVLSTNSIRKCYEQITAYLNADNKEFNITQKRQTENWKTCNHFQENKRHKNKNVEVSNFGRVKINGIIAIQNNTAIDNGELYIKEFGISLKVWTLVAKTWLKKPQDDNCIYDVHHITNNGCDNRPENLIWLKREYHNKINHKIRI